MIDRDNYCKDCTRNIWGEFPTCDVNIENNSRYDTDEKCYCKIGLDGKVELSGGNNG